MQASSSSTQVLLEASTLISQGAEAKVYKGQLHPPSSLKGSNNESGDGSVLLKYRFNKQYRHPSLDTSLTKARVAGEARAIVKCQRAGVNVPSVCMVDAPAGVIALEWIHGKSVRHLLGGGAEDEDEVEGEDGDEIDPGDVQEEDPLEEYNLPKSEVMRKIGTEIAKMHQADVIHGDLTTSNMMLCHPQSGRTDLILIDFGLAYISTLVEDKAVDLYVLERAFSSTHPVSEPLFALILEAYGATVGKEWKTISKRLDDVRLRGRKRSMVG